MYSSIFLLILSQDWTGPGGPPVRHELPAPVDKKEDIPAVQVPALPVVAIPVASAQEDSVSDNAVNPSRDEVLEDGDHARSEERSSSKSPSKFQLPKLKLPKFKFPQLKLFDAREDLPRATQSKDDYGWGFTTSYSQTSLESTSTVHGLRYSLKKRTQGRFDYEFEYRDLNGSDYAILGVLSAPILPNLQLAGTSIQFDFKAGLGYQETQKFTWWGGFYTDDSFIGSVGIDASLPISNQFDLFLGLRLEDDFEFEFDQHAAFLGVQYSF